MAILLFELDQLLMLLVPELVIDVFGAFNCASESDFVKKLLLIFSHFAVLMMDPLSGDPPSKRLAFLVTLWHHAMAILLFKLDQPFTLLVPGLVVGVFGAFNCPNEPNFVQKSLLVRSHFVIELSCPLVADQLPQRLVFLLPEWHHRMAIVLFKLNQLFTLLLPLTWLINFLQGLQGTCCEDRNQSSLKG
jgi:hypothetical protein